LTEVPAASHIVNGQSLREQEPRRIGSTVNSLRLKILRFCMKPAVGDDGATDIDRPSGEQRLFDGVSEQFDREVGALSQRMPPQLPTINPLHFSIYAVIPALPEQVFVTPAHQQE
jgi:hypothetical protein